MTPEATILTQVVIVGMLLTVVGLVIYAVWRGRRYILSPLLSRKFLGFCAAFAFVLMILNPPWRVTRTDDKGHALQTSVQISGIWNDPSRGAQYLHNSAKIATDIISLEFLGLAAVGIAGHFLLPKPRP